MLAGGVALWLCVSAQPAVADKKPGSAGELRVQGELLGRKGRFDEAIEAFKKAEAMEPVPENDCFVAISYARLEKWTQAKLFIERCRSRTGGVPKLPWYGQAEALINNTLSKKGYAAILLRSAPLGARAHLDGTPDDETFETPMSLWLPAGSHTIELEKDGFAPMRTELVTVARDRKTEEIVLKALIVPPEDPPPTVVEPTPVVVEPTPVVVEPTPVVVETQKDRRPRESHLAAWLTLGGGATFLAGGIVAHVSASSARSRAQESAQRLRRRA